MRYSLLSLKDLYQSFINHKTSKHKKYLENIPFSLKDRPRALLTDIFDKISRVTDEMRS